MVVGGKGRASHFDQFILYLENWEKESNWDINEPAEGCDNVKRMSSE